MNQAFICDAVRTPFGRFGGTLANVRADDLAAMPLKALLERNPGLDPALIDDVIYGCANQAGEDNRNVARMALLLAGLPDEAVVARLDGGFTDACRLILATTGRVVCTGMGKSGHVARKIASTMASTGTPRERRPRSRCSRHWLVSSVHSAT